MDGKKLERNEARHQEEDAVLVTGGSGFIGRRLVQKLSNHGKTVVCMYHHRLPEPMANVYPVCSDMGSSELLAAPLRGVETVVHLAWESNFIGPSEKVSWNVDATDLPKNVKLLRNLIHAMEKAGSKRLVFLSAIGASRKTNVPFLQEKYLGEFFVLNSKIPEKIIIRTSLVCGNGGNNDRFVHSIARLMQFPGIYPVPIAKEALSPVFIDDLVSFLGRSVMSNLGQSNSLVEVCGKESFKVDEFFKIISNRFGKNKKIAIKGYLGSSILPLFEREKAKSSNQPIKLRHYLALGSKEDQCTTVGNPLHEIWNKQKHHSVREGLLEHEKEKDKPAPRNPA